MLRRGLREHLPRLSANAVKVYVYLLLRVEWKGADRGTCRATTRALSEELGMRRESMLSAIKELEGLSPKPFIEVERASNRHGLTTYRVLRFDRFTIPKSVPVEPHSTGPTSAPLEPRSTGPESGPLPISTGPEFGPLPGPLDIPKQLHINGLETPKKLNKKYTVKSVEFRPAKNGSYPGWFERFWASYPSRKGAKKPAFKQASKVVVSDDDIELAGQYLAIRVSHIERMKARGAFAESLPHVQRYFSKGLWNQEPEVAAQNSDGFKRSWE